MTTAYPLQWPPGWPRSRTIGGMGLGRFQCSPGVALRGLHDELGRLRAQHVVVSSNCKLSNSGLPYAEDLDARLKDPGVAVYFQFKAKPMVMAQDIYSRPWANMRSLSLAIGAMRAIERHGGGYMMERSFAGFAQLPPPEGGASASLRPWREVLDMDADAYKAIPSDGQLSIAEARYRERARKAHPDNGGSAEAMAELNVAVEAARAELAALGQTGA